MLIEINETISLSEEGVGKMDPKGTKLQATLAYACR
jgi:hypothetical protein